MYHHTKPIRLHEILILVGIIFLLILLVVHFLPYSSILFKRETLRLFIDRAGIFGPLVIIFVMVLETVVAPLPGIFLPTISGFFFGFWLGSLYAYIGDVLGACVAFSLARHFGQPFVQRIASQETVERSQILINKYSRYLFILYAVPIFPIDIVSLLLGISPLPFRRFLTIILLAFVPNILLLNFFGDYLFRASWWSFSMIGIVIMLCIFVWFVSNTRRKSTYL
ncbi:MAG: hypothetical protein A3B74_03835 [Candidatus Kerfeldbacteria bacterium RIFCSPHIGHO2_02_FULL_42_14]|uniref:TVP38/TMEM64 family membrane protein n=1 Tax=Candidatus Kerfeldbacteria bacterium RIFCSPHIGHO2_02_FULL_42_14 TaxID=1798540 RepID=A0A1G2ASJ3_9BACT|nr:MAG: hypothetical protein A3B74_03835 [Candidatus Kerfeldbacteria bacterium RIFCSPHIGHO2_02_FULL_42_14]OGY80644.1 MAG: hypothetical protein A3E60_04335 [Candidatus Kerfeldbacteria bacterium RIFCSPHIGHO2_12_FULL_42_13]OGY82568.1 MAG: hypothetical protein A3I91_03995 [Candidatus Kerfeldbacteria bacterium RIFCSPLOWO2_02_FULL_42_19]OGY85172.1 MAG: hypothetical protein A3G01_01125 [Candidatus Kerfeldbacteria bacterium RIFCSPLOWO2_12_FULL_43_9]